jgi:hypothetical protein
MQLFLIKRVNAMQKTLHTAVVASGCKIERYKEAKIIAHAINADAVRMGKVNEKE